MLLHHETKRSNDVRVPAVPRGKAIIVTRYRRDTPKVALVNPEDLAALEESHDALQALGQLIPPSSDDLTRKTLAIEDRPDAEGSIENAQQIAAILDL